MPVAIIVNTHFLSSLLSTQVYLHEQILLPIAHDLAVQGEEYPMTIIYLKLKYCGYAYNLFERVLGDRQFVGETRSSW